MVQFAKLFANLFRENERYCSVAFKTAFRFSFNKKY